jgi:hypothetical protein
MLGSEPGIAGVVYSITGRVAPGADSMTGSVVIRRSRRGAAPDTLPVTLRAVRLASNDSSGGWYSSASYNAQGGDLTGEEVILLSTAAGLEGVYVSHEDERLPYTMYDVRRSGDTIAFAIRTSAGEERYRGELTNERLTLRRVDANAASGLPDRVLRRRGSVSLALGTH